MFLRVSSLFVCTLMSIAIVGALGVLSVHAQEGTIATTTESVAVSSAAIEEINQMPYEVEQLTGDEVFGDFVLGPGKVELTVNPGETKEVFVTVSNRTGSPRTFEISTEDAGGSSDPTQTLVLLGDDRGPYSLKDYLVVESKRFELGHNQRARVPVTVSIPANAEPGGLYGSLLVSTVSTEARAGGADGTKSQSAIVSRIGTLFFITIPGAIEKGGSFKEFSTVPKKTFYQSGPIRFGILFENTGSIHLTPRGELRVTNMFGEEVGNFEIEPWFVLPKAIRLREVAWNRDFLFGRYTATAYIDRGYDNVIEDMSYTFWVLPWKPITVGFAVVFLGIFAIRTFFKRFEFKRKT